MAGGGSKDQFYKTMAKAFLNEYFRNLQKAKKAKKEFTTKG
jgi:hypothetical protein